MHVTWAERLDPKLLAPVRLTPEEFDALVELAHHGLLDPDAEPQFLRRFIPKKLPSGHAGLIFQF